LIERENIKTIAMETRQGALPSDNLALSLLHWIITFF
jgi:hypothetical protein